MTDKEKYEREVEQNAKDAVRDLKMIKNILYDIPKAIIKPAINKTIRNFKHIPFGLEFIDNLVDDVNPFDLINPIVRSAKFEIQSWKDWIKETKSEINKIKEENQEMKKTSKNAGTNSKYGSANKSRNGVTLTAARGARTNHPEWYLRNPDISKQLVGINIANRQNVPSDYMRSLKISDTNGVVGVGQYSVPSVATIKLVLTIPKSQTNDWKQGVNAFYQNVRRSNAGAVNADPYQYANYIYTIRTMDAALAYLERAIACMEAGTFYDAVSPQVYFAAMGLDYDSFVANAANAKELYTRLANIRRIGPMLNISLLDRTRWLFSNVFKESDDIKSQHYLFGAEKLYTIDSGNNVYVHTIADFSNNDNTTGKTYEEFVSAILDIFDIYQSDKKFAIIAGDILKAFGTEVVYSPVSVENIRFEPSYDIHTLTQIQNATLSALGDINPQFGNLEVEDFVFNTINESVSNTIFSDTSRLPAKFVETFNYMFETPMYNSNEDVVDNGRILSSTRLMASRRAKNAPGAADTALIEYVTFGTEVVEDILIWYNSDNLSKPYGIDRIVVNQFMNTAWVDNSGVGYDMDAPAWTWFDYFPYVISVLTDGRNKEFYYQVPNFDFNNFGFVYRQNLDTYNAIATLSMLYTRPRYKGNKTEVIPV